LKQTDEVGKGFKQTPLRLVRVRFPDGQNRRLDKRYLQPNQPRSHRQWVV